jgi:anti-sigma factor RsiW
MGCRKKQARLSAYLDGELSPKAAAAVREHLEACPQCASVLDRLAALDGALETVDGLTPPLGFVGRIVAVAEAQRERAAATRVPVFGRLRPAFSRVAALVTLVAGLWLGATLGGSVSGTNVLVAETEDESVLDLQVDSLSAAPPGSLAEAYLYPVAESE